MWPFLFLDVKNEAPNLDRICEVPLPVDESSYCAGHSYLYQHFVLYESQAESA